MSSKTQMNEAQIQKLLFRVKIFREGQFFLICPNLFTKYLLTSKKIEDFQKIETFSKYMNFNIKSIHCVNSSAQGSCLHKLTADVSSGQLGKVW